MKCPNYKEKEKIKLLVLKVFLFSITINNLNDEWILNLEYSNHMSRRKMEPKVFFLFFEIKNNFQKR